VTENAANVGDVIDGTTNGVADCAIVGAISDEENIFGRSSNFGLKTQSLIISSPNSMPINQVVHSKLRPKLLVQCCTRGTKHRGSMPQSLLRCSILQNLQNNNV
jgi:hypothetical protein